MPAKTRSQIEARLRKGMLPRDIAAATGCHLSTVHRIGRELGLTREPGRPRGETERGRGKRAEALKLAAEGLSVAEIALQIDRSERAVYGYLREGEE